MELVILGGNIFPKAYAISVLKDSGSIGRITFYQRRDEAENSNRTSNPLMEIPKATPK